jgi:hypothetical protein
MPRAISDKTQVRHLRAEVRRLQALATEAETRAKVSEKKLYAKWLESEKLGKTGDGLVNCTTNLVELIKGFPLAGGAPQKLIREQTIKSVENWIRAWKAVRQHVIE